MLYYKYFKSFVNFRLTTALLIKGGDIVNVRLSAKVLQKREWSKCNMYPKCLAETFASY